MTTTTDRAPRTGPALPEARGPLSARVRAALTAPEVPAVDTAGAATADPYGEDLHVALHTLYELHYRGFAGVPEDHEWHPALMPLRRALEERFLGALRADVPGGRDVAEVFDGLLVEPADHTGSVAYHLEHEGTGEQLREYAALRSLYHLKEADPHLWVVPRLTGRAKAGMVAIQYDEYGAGRAEGMHARLFADLMTDLGLETRYGHYVDAAPRPRARRRQHDVALRPAPFAARRARRPLRRRRGHLLARLPPHRRRDAPHRGGTRRRALLRRARRGGRGARAGRAARGDRRPPRGRTGPRGGRRLRRGGDGPPGGPPRGAPAGGVAGGPVGAQGHPGRAL
ncbi:LOW QUALITY PROTEIN: conserved hypothetical protein, partial [Streptomyces sp. SPB78]